MAKTRSFGTKVYLDGIAIGGLTDVNISAGDVTNVDTTCHNTVDGFRTFVAGLKDGGTVELSGKYDYADAGQEDWREAMGDTATIYIIMPDNSGFAMNVIVGSFNATAPLDDAAEFTASAKITGEVFPVYPTMTVTGITVPAASDPLVMTLEADPINGKITYSNADWDIDWTTGSWRVVAANASYLANLVSTALTPDGLTGWTITTGTGQPTLTGS